MKIRNGFVSNSSSSSFIVAIKEKKKQQISVSVDDIMKFIDGEKKSTKEVIDELEEYKDDCEDENENEYSPEKIKDLEKKGYRFFNVTVDQGADGEMMERLEKFFDCEFVKTDEY